MRFLKFALLLSALFLIGTLGYVWIEDWPAFDAFYMTVITLTTTGYSEIHDLSQQGRVFTVFLMLGGVSLFTYGLRELFASQFNFMQRRRKRMKKKIRDLSNHVVLCGFGRMGSVIAEQLYNKNFPFVVIEKRPEAIENLKQSPYLWLEGDAADDNDLIELNIEQAKFIVIVIEHDADTLYTLLAAKNMNPDIIAMCRASNEQAKIRLTRLGADRVVLPLYTSALKVSQLLINPALENLIDLSGEMADSPNQLKMVELDIESDSKYVGQTLQNAFIDKKGDHFLVVAIIKEGSDLQFKPDNHYQISIGDKIVGLCPANHMDQIRTHFDVIF